MEAPKSKKKPPFNEDATLRGAWRRVFARSPFVREVMEEGKRRVAKFNQDGSRAKVDAVEVNCQVCNKWVRASVGGKSNISVDHVIPVIDVTDISGKVKDWNVYKKRLFCDKKNLQRICKPCHELKTDDERSRRNALKDKMLLDALEVRVNTLMTVHEAKDLKKEVSKFTTKTKGEEARQRAVSLKAKLVDIIERQD